MSGLNLGMFNYLGYNFTETVILKRSNLLADQIGLDQLDERANSSFLGITKKSFLLNVRVTVIAIKRLNLFKT